MVAGATGVAVNRWLRRPRSSAHGHQRLRGAAGEPIHEDDDLFGSSVIAAARIAAQELGGQVLVTDVVRQLTSGRGFTFSDLGERALRGFSEPVRGWELLWE